MICISIRKLITAKLLVAPTEHKASPGESTAILPIVFDCRFSFVNWLKMASEASMPLFIAVCVPLILGTFMSPGLQPINNPPGKVSLGIDWRGKKKSILLSEYNMLEIKLAWD